MSRTICIPALNGSRATGAGDDRVDVLAGATGRSTCGSPEASAGPNFQATPGTPGTGAVRFSAGGHGVRRPAVAGPRAGRRRPLRHTRGDVANRVVRFYLLAGESLGHGGANLREGFCVMDWMERVVLLLSGGVSGAIVTWLGVARDRLAAVRIQQIDAMTRLHERVLEIARKELFDGKSMTLAVRVEGGTRTPRTLLDSEEVEYQSRLGQWREKLREEEDRARLWIDAHTVRLVSTYFLVMMQCSSWEEFGQGILTEDKEFIRRLRVMFGGNTNRVLNDVVKRRSDNKKAWLVDCVELSDRCLSVIQRRVRREIAHPVLFGIGRWLEVANGTRRRM